MHYRDLVAAAQEQITEVDPATLASRLADGILVVDVREQHEFDQGSIANAVLMPRGTIEGSIATIAPDSDQPIALYCSVGARSALAAQSLEELGYRNVVSLAGGFDAWKQAGHDWVVPDGGLSGEQRSRYARHLRLPEVGVAGQEQLLSSRVLLVGAGGLGSPVALYLAAAGVGTIGIIDDDVVDATNLQRQVVHRLDRVGEAKVESARSTIGALNPDVKVEPYRQRLEAANAVHVISSYDLVVDGADNFPTRYLLNDASLHARVPIVHGSIYRFEGQATVFQPYEGPCYRCLFPEPPPPHLAPSCEEGGVLGVLPGVMGTIQATEAIKLLLGIGSALTGRLLTYDALSGEFDELRFSRDTKCQACANPDDPPVVTDYDDACRPIR